MDRWNTFGNAAFCTEYDEDILDTLKEVEMRREIVRFPSTQRHHRQSLVDLIRNVCELLVLERATLHLAVYMLDVFMSEHTIPDGCLNLVALACLYVASKIEEIKAEVPTPTMLSNLLLNGPQPSEIIRMEVKILKFFNWYLTVPTASTFLDMFMLENTGTERRPTNDCPINRCLNNTCLDILDASLDLVQFVNLKPSLLAAACVAAARSSTQNVSLWSDRLTRVTGYNYPEIVGLCQRLLCHVIPASPSSGSASGSTPMRSICDSGYLSDRGELPDYPESSDDDSDVSSMRDSSLSSPYHESSDSSGDSPEYHAKRRKFE